MARNVTRVVVVVAMALIAVLGASAAAASSTTPPPSSLGYDVSFPQCNTPLPPTPGFGVVGVNNGYPFSINPCLNTELQWAMSSAGGKPQFYANTANPGPSSNADWPKGQQTPDVCDGTDSTGCSYDYGWNAAQGSFENAVNAETAVGAASPQSSATSATWWLDVETGNSWESLGTTSPTATQLGNDQADLQGELAYFASVGVANVGVYSTGYQFGQIVGTPGTVFPAIPVWLPGYATQAAAQAACANTSFTGGRVTMIQYALNGLDGDYLCGLVSVPATVSVPVTQAGSFSQQLTVTGEGSPVTYVQNSGAPYLVVSSTGLVSANGALAAGVYVASGYSSTPTGLTGEFSLTVTVGQMTQTSPATVLVPISQSSTFVTQVSATGGVGPLTYTQTTGPPNLIVSSSGQVRTSGTLARGTYTVAGSVSDATGDKGTYALTVKVGYVAQTSAIRATVSPAASAGFTTQVSATGGVGPLTYTQTTGLPNLIVSSSGQVRTSGTLANGSYVVRGAVSDATGDHGVYFFNLLVEPGLITQSSPTTIDVAPTALSNFTAQITVSGAIGTLDFAQTSGSPDVTVSSTGLVTVSPSLALGTYEAAGTVNDPSGDHGTFGVSIQVATPPIVLPIATRVVGHAVAGRAVTLQIRGRGFFGRPRIVAHAGTTVVVTKDSGTSLTVRVTVAVRSRPGVYRLVITLPNGKSTSVRYVLR